MQQELEFIKILERNCPVAKFGWVVTIVFVHYTTEKKQKKNRKYEKRINWNNLYIISSDGKGATLADFKKLDKVKCKRKLIFTSRPRPEISDSFYLKSLKDQESAAGHMITLNHLTSLWNCLDDFDFVAWLNDEKKFDK